MPSRRKPFRIWTALCLASVLGACGTNDDALPVKVSVIGNTEEIAAPLTHIDSIAGQVSFTATAEGLVTYNANGEVVPGIAQRWIVVDDGLTYIFRLRRSHWANGEKVVAKDVKRLLQARLRAVARTDPYGSLAAISEIIAMTDDVLEIDLKTPRQDFLMALAQPVMGVALPDGGSGPYHKSQSRGAGGLLTLTLADKTGDPDVDDAESSIRLLRAERPTRAIVRFQQRLTDLVLGGTLADIPYVSLAEINSKAVSFDPVQGLFGLALSARNPMFNDPHVREALSMAIEREVIVGYFAINRWKIADRILPQQYDIPHPPTGPQWASSPIDDRRNLAVGTMTRWRAQHGDKPIQLSVEMPKGPGMDLLFIALKDQYRKIGVELARAEKNGDMVLIDEVAPYDSAAWYLSRLSCSLGVHCDPQAEELLKASVAAPSMTERLTKLGEAEVLMQAHGGFIPLATPVRWSLVANRLDGFSPSPRGFHPLPWLLQ